MITFDELKKTVEKLKSRPGRAMTAAEIEKYFKCRAEMAEKIKSGLYAIIERKGKA